MRYCGRLLMALAIAIGALTTGGATLLAQDATPADGSPVAIPLPEGCTVVADGLLNPRYVRLATDGTLYVTEAGTGGEEPVGGGPEGEEGEGGPPLTRGMSGQVTAVSPDGVQTVVASGLASYAEGAGPTGIVLGDGVIWVAIGGGAGIRGIDPLETENTVVQIDLATGEATVVADLGAFEIENNPDDSDVNPNLYGMDMGADGQLYVADAGGNTIYRVDPATGELTLLGVVPGPQLPGGPPEAEASPAVEASPIADEGEFAGPPQSVPTGVHLGADGNIYVATLGAFIPGAAEIVIAQADGSFVQAAAGLTLGIGVALGPDGALYVTQLASLTSPDEPPGPGNVVRIEADGTITPVVEGIPFPHGITFDAEGNLYVVAYSTAFGPPLGPGQV